jgi:lambda repressor-like predicted transcriptional regulator
MHPADIQAEIKKAGLTQKAIAQEYGCSEFNISRIINTRWGSEPVMKFIANKIGKEPHTIFPKYFMRTKRRARKSALRPGSRPRMNRAA